MNLAFVLAFLLRIVWKVLKLQQMSLTLMIFYSLSFQWRFRDKLKHMRQCYNIQCFKPKFHSIQIYFSLFSNDDRLIVEYLILSNVQFSSNNQNT